MSSAILSLILGFSLVFGFIYEKSDNEEKTARTYSLADFIDQHYLAYKFDKEGYYHPSFGLEGKKLTLQERKKAILYSYFELQKSRYSDSYAEMVDRLQDISLNLLENAPQTNEPLLSWSEFKEEYQKQGVSKLPFIGYGSSVNRANLKRALSKERKMEPIVGFGAKRLFKVQSSASFTRGLPTEGFENENAMLALQETDLPLYDLNNLYNGVVFDLQVGEVELMQKKEPDYKIKKVPIIKIQNLFKKPVRLEYAYALINNSEGDKESKPHLNYLNLIINGFDDGDLEEQDLIRLFSESTYLADGKTTLDEWLQEEVEHYYHIQQMVRPIVLHHNKLVKEL